MKIKIKSALISVTDKTNLREILVLLKKFKIDIVSSGGTYKRIKQLGYSSTEVSKYTNFPEMLDGRVKTLHPKIHAGILNKRNNKLHKKQMNNHGYKNIDLVIVNFYEFEKILKGKQKIDDVIENIDIGGPSMVRGAAKNFKNVTVISSIHNYKDLVLELSKNVGFTTLDFRKRMAEFAFSETAFYDAIISNYFKNLSKNKFPNKKIIFGKKLEDLRYGENPHQKGALYSTVNNSNVKQFSGKKLSYNNYNDLFSAIDISKSFPKNKGTVIVKHGNPCGVSITTNKINSYKYALKCDPVSAFGGIVSCNFKINKLLAVELSKNFLEIVVGKGFEKAAINILKRKKNLRIIDSSNLNKNDNESIISNFSSLLIQTTDNKIIQKRDVKVVSKKKPNKSMMNNLIFAFNVCKYVKSNAIVLTRDFCTVGIGSGQSSRLDSCNIAIEKMNRFKLFDEYSDICAASDAFFPFVDGIEKLALSGVKAIIQPSGSVRDREIINFADKLGLVLVFSNTRHFKH